MRPAFSRRNNSPEPSLGSWRSTGRSSPATTVVQGNAVVSGNALALAGGSDVVEACVGGRVSTGSIVGIGNVAGRVAGISVGGCKEVLLKSWQAGKVARTATSKRNRFFMKISRCVFVNIGRLAIHDLIVGIHGMVLIV